MPPPPLPAEPRALRVVFFGPPRSGKSKLLDLIAAVARSEADDVIPLVPAEPPAPGGVVRRRMRVDLPGPRAETGDVEYIDCDGQAAEQLLRDAGQLKQREAQSELVRQVRDTDALVLVVDAKSSPAVVEQTFTQFRGFLDALQAGRAAERQVGGLPVFLTLCKCDELATPGEPWADWLTRVKQEQEKLEQRFHEFFDADGEEEQFLTFGSTDLIVSATAATWPNVTGGVPDDTGGFEIGNLHREILLAARDHYERAARSRRRLSATAAIAVSLMAVILLLLGGLALTREPSAADSLAARVKRMRESFGPAEVRLATRNFDAHRREVEAVFAAEVFSELPAEPQQYVRGTLAEFESYAEYRRRFDPPQFAPADLRTINERKELDAALVGPLLPPPEYADAWKNTEAVRLRAKWADDLERLGAAEKEVNQWYGAQLGQLAALQLADVPSEQWTATRWRTSVGEAIGRRPPFAETAPLPGALSVPGPRGEAISYAAAYRYEQAKAAADDWRKAADALADVRDLADALGLTVDPAAPDAVLVLAPPGDKPDAKLAAVRLAKLKARFPRAVGGKAAWQITNIAGPLRKTLAAKLKEAKDNGVDTVRALLRADPADTDWPKLANGLLASPDLKAWGELLRLLVGWADPARPDEDPVTHLREFVAKPAFAFEIDRVVVTIPHSLLDDPPTADGHLTMNVGTRSYRFTPAKTRIEANRTTLEYTPKDGTVKFTPGEVFAADLTVASGAAKHLLKWTETRTPKYAFGALLREPTIEAKANPVPVPADGVRVTVTTTAGDEFRVPLLLPETK